MRQICQNEYWSFYTMIWQKGTARNRPGKAAARMDFDACIHHLPFFSSASAVRRKSKMP
jgi:hypothetical protein